jgi:hypothetical protein
MDNLDKRLSIAVMEFWSVRKRQSEQQGAKRGKKDVGGRQAVTGGAQLSGLVKLIKDLLEEAGLPEVYIHTKANSLPGYFRPIKDWDLAVISNGNLIASIELKSQVGPSFGNNFNNRVEEALGSATDLWRASREGAFKPSRQPWLGYLMLLEEDIKSISPVKIKQAHFPVFPEFINASYAKRYELFCERLVRERLYNAACFILSNREGGLKGEYVEPSEELSFAVFAKSLVAQTTAFIR